MKKDIFVNELAQSIPEDMTVGTLRDEKKPGADVIIVNGYPCGDDYVLQEGDHVVLIRRGEIPDREELEAQMIARHSPGVHERMKTAIVGVAGLGGLGSSVSIALARMGIGTLIIADHDVVEPSNLNRQQYFIDQIGLAKTDAMIKILAGVNPYVQVAAHRIILTKQNIPEIFEKADIIVECFDRAEEKTMILETVAEFLPEVYVIGASGLAGYGDSNSIQTRKIGKNIFMIGDMERAAGPGQGLMAPRVGIAAHHQANLAVSLLINPDQTISQIPDIID
jgi:sulfur carrier protein ThiS adenylyltransferase